MKMEFKIAEQVRIISVNGDIHVYKRLDETCYNWGYKCVSEEGIFKKTVDLSTVGYSILDALAHDARVKKEDGIVTLICRE
jgi:hypothetical protein